MRGIPSKVTFFKHPIHPMLVGFPTAFLLGACLADLALFFTRDFFWVRAAYWLLIAGVPLGLLAGLVGLIDFFSIARANTHGSGWSHLITNVIVLALAALNLSLRLENPGGYVLFLGLRLSVLTAVLMLIGNWHGGELSFGQGIGMFGRGSEEAT